MRKRVVLAILLAMAVIAVPAMAASEAAIEDSIEAGLAWLATQQKDDGSWWYLDTPSPNPGVTGLVVLKFEDRAKETMPSKDPFDPGYPYHSNVEMGLENLFGQMQGDISSINIGQSNYFTSIALMAVAASNNPGRTVASGPFNGETYQDVAQGMVNWLVATQQSTDPTPFACEEGGWSYGWNLGGEWVDQSNSGYSVLALAQAQAPAPDGFGIAVPPSVIARLLTFTTNVQDANGGSVYNPCWSGENLKWINILKTGTLLQELAFCDIGEGDSRVTNAVGYIEDHWTDSGRLPAFPATSLGWVDSYQAMFTMMKGFEAYEIEEIDPAINWYEEVSTVIVANQNLDGSFKWINAGTGKEIGEGENSANLRAAWALLTLERAVPPVRKISIDKEGSPNPATVGQTITYTYIVTNIGNVDLTEVVVTDSLPGVNPVRVSGDDVLNPGETWTYEATVTAGEIGTIINTGTVTASADGRTVTAEDEESVEVINTPPITKDAYPSLNCLWPPNHQFVPVEILGVTDPDIGQTVTITIDAVWSDEPTSSILGAGGADKCPDASGVLTPVASLRVERSGTNKKPGNGRVYTIDFTASDGFEETSGSVEVCVPHDQSKKPCDCWKDGEIDATVCN